MKKLSIVLASLIVTIASYSQNGGQLNENAVIKMDYISYSNYHTTVRITNKQLFPADIELKCGSLSRVKFFAANAIDTMILVGLQGQNVKIQAKPLNAEAGNLGQVELFLNINYLPVKFGEIKITPKNK